MNKRFYRPQLDVARCCAFLAIFCHHVLPRTGNRYAFINNAVDACGFGLSLFFVLSAYLITMLLLREHANTGTVHLPQFYLRRILRVWPLYFVGVAVGVLRSVAHHSLERDWPWFAAALLFSGNLILPGAILMSHLWSISVEEQFYLLFPFAASRGGRRGILLFALALVVSANIALVYFAHQHSPLDATVWFSSLVQFQMFAAGILLALADDWLPRLPVPVAVFGVAASLALLYTVSRTYHLKTMGVAATSAGGLCLGYALVAFACCLFLICMQSLPAWPPLVYAGKISFGLYVFHIPAYVLVSPHVADPTLGILLSLALTFGLAALSYHLFESRFLQVKRRFEFIATRAV